MTGKKLEKNHERIAGGKFQRRYSAWQEPSTITRRAEKPNNHRSFYFRYTVSENRSAQLLAEFLFRFGTRLKRLICPNIGKTSVAQLYRLAAGYVGQEEGDK